MDSLPQKNEESSATQVKETPSAARASGEQPSNRVVMLLGLDPNTTQGIITEAFDNHGLKVTVDYRRDDTIGYVQLHLPIAKEITENIMKNGGLKVGAEVVVCRALEGMEDLMYWSVYAGSRIIMRSGGSYNTGKIRHQRRTIRQQPYPQLQIADIDDDVEQTPKYQRPKLLVKSKISKNKLKKKVQKKPKVQKTNRSPIKKVQKALNKEKKRNMMELDGIEQSSVSKSEVITNKNFKIAKRMIEERKRSMMVIDAFNTAFNSTPGNSYGVEQATGTLTSPVNNRTITGSFNKNEVGICRWYHGSTYGPLNDVEDFDELSEADPFENIVDSHASTRESSSDPLKETLTVSPNSPRSFLTNPVSSNTLRLNNNPFITIPQHSSPLKQEFKLENKDEADEVEEKFKQLFLNQVGF